VQGLVEEAGVDPDAIQLSRHGADSRTGPAVKLAYEKPVAVPPQCRDWATDLGENRERLPYNDFGCASQRNFALTVANARDIQVPQPETPRSSEKRSAGWDDYTGAVSGADASAVGAPVTTTTTSK
jgi:pilus assembly protein CpaD